MYLRNKIEKLADLEELTDMSQSRQSLYYTPTDRSLLGGSHLLSPGEPPIYINHIRDKPMEAPPVAGPSTSTREFDWLLEGNSLRNSSSSQELLWKKNDEGGCGDGAKCTSLPDLMGTDASKEEKNFETSL